MDFRTFITDYLNDSNFDASSIQSNILSLAESELEDGLALVLELSANDTISKKEGLKVLTFLMSSLNSTKRLKALVVHAIIKLKTYKAIPVFVDFITEPRLETQSVEAGAEFYDETKNTVLDVLAVMAQNKTKALNGLFRIAEIGDMAFKTEAVKRIKDLYSEKPKEELLAMIAEEAQRQGEQSLLHAMHKQL